MSFIQIIGAAAAPPPPPPAGPLDPYTAGLWCAYGLTRTLSAYGNGPAINVRRSSDNATQDINFLTSGALDTGSLAAFVGGNSAFIVTVYDHSGAGNHFTQPTAANQARIVNAGVYDSTIYFDGSNDYFNSVNNAAATSAASLYLGGTFRGAGSGYNTFLVSDPAFGSGSASSGSVQWDFDHTFGGYRNAILSNGGSDVVVNEVTGVSLSNSVHAIVSDFTQTTNPARVPYYAGGALKTPSISTAGTIPTTATVKPLPWYFGSAAGGAGAAALSINVGAIYSVAHSAATVAAISAALAPVA